MKSKFLRTLIAIIFIAFLVVIFSFLTVKTAKDTYNDRVANEKNTEIDYYKMEGYARDNAVAILDALKDGDKEYLEENILNPSNIQELMKIANWENVDLDKKTSFGTGSFMSKPDKNGKMDVGELISIKDGKRGYVIYIQTVTSRWGKINDGVSCVAVATRKRFDHVDYAWEWQTDKETLRAGKPFV